MGRQHRTLLRNLTLTLIALTLAYLSLTYYVRHRFPPREVGRLLSRFLTEQTPFSVDIGSVRFNLLRGFQVNRVRLIRSQQNRSTTRIDSVHIEQILFRYRPLQLLHRRLRIQTVEIQGPHVWLTGATAPADRPFRAHHTRLATGSMKPTTAPLDLHVTRLELQNLGLTAQLTDGKRSAAVETRGWNLSVFGVALQRTDTVPRLQHLRISHPGRDLHIQFSADTVEATVAIPLQFLLELTNSPFGDTARLNLVCQFDNGDLRWISPHKQIHLQDLPAPLRLQAEGWFKVDVQAPTDSLNSSGKPVFSLSAHFPVVALRLLGSSDFYGSALLEAKPGEQKLTFSLGAGSFPVQAWLQILAQVVPEASSAVSLGDPAAGLSFLEFQGNGEKSPLETATLSLSGNFRTLSLRYHPSQISLDSLRSEFDFSASLAKSGIRNLDLHTIAVASGVAGHTGTRVVSLNGITLEVGATFDSTLWIRTADLDFQIDDALGGTAFVTSHWFTPGSRKSLRGEIRSELQNLEVANLTEQPLHGRLAFQSTFRVPGDGSVHAAARWLVDSLVLETPDQPIAFPPVRGEFKGRGRFNPETRRMSLRDWQLWLPGFLVARGDLYASPDSAFVLLQHFRVHPGNIVDWVRPLLPPTSTDVVLGGILNGSAVARFGKPRPALAGSLYVLNGLFARPSSELAIGKIRFNSAFKGTLDSLWLCGQGRMDSLWIGSFGKRPLTDTRLQVRATVFPSQSLIRLDTVTAHHEPLNLRALAHGEIRTEKPDTEVVTLDYTFTMLADSFGPLGDVAQLRGAASGNGQILMLGDFLHVEGMVQPRTLCARFATGLELDTLAGCVHYDLLFDVAGEEPVFLSEHPEESPNPLAAAGYDTWRWLAPAVDTLYIQRIRFLRYTLESLRAHVVARNGFIYVPSFRINAYGGAIGGRVLLDFRNRTSTAGAYNAEIQISRLNTVLLKRRRRGKASYITGTVRVRGEGFQPQSLNSVRGSVRFTELGPTVADDILASLDPQGTNPGIRNTRRLLALGFRPLQMSFKLRQGYFYPSLKLAQPWFSPVRLSGGKIDIGRLPLEPFLKATPGGASIP